MSATTVCFISEKGGVGKTTAVYHIGAGLQRWHQKNVLFVDADYQRGGLTVRLLPSLLEHFKDGTAPGMTVYHVFQALYSAQTVFPVPEVQQTPIGIDLLPADPRLSGVAAEKLPTSNNIRANNQLLFRHLGIMREVLKPHIENYDYILIDTHPETSELMRTVIYASDYAISPVKLDEQSSVGVPSAIEAVNAVNEDVAALGGSLNVPNDYSPTQYAGAIGMMAREWGVRLKRTERSQYRRLGATGGIFEAYVTEGDGIRKAAEQRCPVYDIGGANAKKQTAQFRDVVTEFLDKCV